MIRKNKYNNQKITYDNIKFDSKKEFNYYLLLKEKLENGEIKKLEVHKKFNLLPKNNIYRELNYIADFFYIDKNGNEKIIDIKPSKKYLTEVFKIKQKLFYFIYNKQIEIIY